MGENGEMMTEIEKLKRDNKELMEALKAAINHIEYHRPGGECDIWTNFKEVSRKIGEEEDKG